MSARHATVDWSCRGPKASSFGPVFFLAAGRSQRNRPPHLCHPWRPVMHQITIAPANGPMKKPTVPASPFLTTARKRKRPPRQKRSGAFPALVWGQVVRFFFTPQDTTCDWGNNGLFRPEGIQSTPIGAHQGHVLGNRCSGHPPGHRCPMTTGLPPSGAPLPLQNGSKGSGF